MNRSLSIKFPALSILLVWLACSAISLTASGEYRQHQTLSLDFEIDATRETAAINPFRDYRLQVTFEQGDRQYSVPGFYAADGNAANTGADAGGVWRVYFTPPKPGAWTYTVSFRRGADLAVEDDPYSGKPIKPYDGQTGSFDVLPPARDATGFAATGRVIYANSHYWHTEDGQPLLLFGANSPENFLAYADIDGTYSYDPGRNYLKSWAPHLADWKEGDPTWMGDKGKGIIGALNYLASQQMNVVFALLLNIEGDARDVWPFISHHKHDFTRYDVSKLAQWEIIFRHAESLGISLNLAFQEQENQLILDDGDTRIERRLFLREMIARFAHLKNIIWNIGEENGGQYSYWPQGQSDQQRFAMIRYLKDRDPYDIPIVVGTYPNQEERMDILNRLLRFDRFDGISMQSGKSRYIHGDVKYWIDKSAKYNRPWVVMQDELGPWHTGTPSDADDTTRDRMRKEVLWAALMAGAGGVEWYFGWMTPPNDLNAEDWRSRETMWQQSAVAHDFFKQLDYTAMRHADELLEYSNDYCFAKPGDTYAVYLVDGGTAKLDLRDVDGQFTVRWYNPRIGGTLQEGTVKTVRGGNWVKIGKAPSEVGEDWAVLVRR